MGAITTAAAGSSRPQIGTVWSAPRWGSWGPLTSAPTQLCPDRLGAAVIIMEKVPGRLAPAPRARAAGRKARIYQGARSRLAGGDVLTALAKSL